MQSSNDKSDLKERTFNFSTKSIELFHALPKTPVNNTIASQFLRSALSIGANYREADGTDTRKDFTYKMGLSKKEAKETYYWLGLLQFENKKRSNLLPSINKLIQESKELMLIFSSIVVKTKRKSN